MYIYIFDLACDYRISEGQDVEEEEFCGIAYADRFNDTFSLASKNEDNSESFIEFEGKDKIISSSDKVCIYKNRSFSYKFWFVQNYLTLFVLYSFDLLFLSSISFLDHI